MTNPGDGMERPTMDVQHTGTGFPSPSGNVTSLWDVEDRFWADNYATRPYAAGRAEPYDRFRPAYRYGFEAAQHHAGRTWDEAERDLRTGWDRYEHRDAAHPSTWDEIKEAARDAWHRVTGQGTANSPAERIGEAFEQARERR